MHLDVLCDCGVCANAVPLHQGDQIPLRQPGGRLREALRTSIADVDYT